MASKTKKVEINIETWETMKKMFDDNEKAYEKLDIHNVDQFINYVVDNFTKSSKDFEQIKLSDGMKSLIDNLDVSNINLEDLFNSLIKTSKTKDKKETEKPTSTKTKKS